MLVCQNSTQNLLVLNIQHLFTSVRPQAYGDLSQSGPVEGNGKQAILFRVHTFRVNTALESIQLELIQFRVHTFRVNTALESIQLELIQFRVHTFRVNTV